MPKRAYNLYRPVNQTSSVVFASPHSGCDYPEWFLRRTLLNAHSIRSSEDAFVDKLFASAPEFGSPVLVAGAPRAFLDLNRSPEELDPPRTKFKAKRKAVKKDNLLLLKQRLAYLGLEEKIVKGDGNCQFRSVAQEMFGSSVAYPKLRAACVDYIERGS